MNIEEKKIMIFNFVTIMFKEIANYNIIDDVDTDYSSDDSVDCLGLLSDNTPIIINTIPTSVPIIAPTKDATQLSADLL